MKTKLFSVNKKAIKAFILIIVGGFMVGCSNNSTNPAGPPQMPGPNEVWIQNFAFSPNTITIAKGTTITWTNKDSTMHSIASGMPGNMNNMYHSGNMNGNMMFSFTFNEAGTFNYYCQIHPGMTGTIIVQ